MLTKTELQGEAREAGLSTSGTKAELLDRLGYESAAKARDECVVDDGTPHTGRAVNGVVCSAHAMHYRADGTRR
jgi:hypothetical protein